MYLSCIIALTVIHDLAVALPSLYNVSSKSQFSIAQVVSRRGAPDGLEAYMRDQAKHGLDKPPHQLTVLKAALLARDVGGSQGSVEIAPDAFDHSYAALVTINGEELRLDIDTGSPDIWAFSSLQSHSQLIGHNYIETSSALELEGETMNLVYADGDHVDGSLYQTTVTIGGLTVKDQAVGAAKIASSRLVSRGHVDGIFGLGFSGPSGFKPTKQKTFLDNIRNQLHLPLFTVDLRKGASGTLNFGFIDESSYIGALSYYGVDSSQGFWEINVSGFAVGTGSITFAPFKANVDTGATLLYLPADLTTSYYSVVDGAEQDEAGNWFVPCNADLPSLSLVIGLTSFAVPGSYIKWQTGDTTEICYSGLQAQEEPEYILGAVFLKAVFAVFDFHVPQIGFAQKAGVDATPSDR